MSTFNKVRSKVLGRYEEALASGICSPGHLLTVDSDGKVLKNSALGLSCERLFALEDGLQGYPKGQWDAFAVGDLVGYHVGQPGDELLGVLKAGQTAVIGSRLCSAGDGTLIVAPANGGKLSSNVASSTAISNTVSTEQFFDKNYTVPANLLQVGDVLSIRGHCTVSAQASTDTSTFKVYLGSTALITSAAVDSAVGDIFIFDIKIVIRTIGASGTFVADVLSVNGVPATATIKGNFVASTAIDTTATQLIRVSVTWSATSATNTCALDELVVELSGRGGYNVIGVSREALDLSSGSDTRHLIRLV